MSRILDDPALGNGLLGPKSLVDTRPAQWERCGGVFAYVN
jgi:hypothetical protein